MTGVLPPIHRPDATAKASPSRQTGINPKSFSACVASYMNLDSLSGYHTTCVIPHFFNCSMMVLGCNTTVPPRSRHRDRKCTHMSAGSLHRGQINNVFCTLCQNRPSMNGHPSDVKERPTAVG